MRQNGQKMGESCRIGDGYCLGKFVLHEDVSFSGKTNGNTSRVASTPTVKGPTVVTKSARVAMAKANTVHH